MLSDVRSVIDIAIVSFIIYRILVLLVGTRAVQLVKGVLILVAVSALASWFRMRLLSWFIGSALLALSFAVPIVFQPELRKMLEELGKGQFYLLKPKMSDDEADVRAKQVAGALNYLKAHKIGALLVLQREVGLADYYNTAIHLNSNITQELLISIFWKDNPLHDGAVILDRYRLIAGGCYLPLADAPVFGLDFSVVFFLGRVGSSLPLFVPELILRSLPDFRDGCALRGCGAFFLPSSTCALSPEGSSFPRLRVSCKHSRCEQREPVR